MFSSFFLGGFECSTHRRAHDRKRLDLIASTRHDEFARQDYARLRDVGIQAARDGLRWHRVEVAPHRYDWSSVVPLIRAAREHEVKVVWDVCHYGWPDDLDATTPDFVDRFASLCAAFARLLREEGDDVPFLSPMNELSFVAWAGGAMGIFPPFLRSSGRDFKRQLVRATIQGSEAILEAVPSARLFHVDPICNVVASENATPDEARLAREYDESQFETWDMIAGRRDEDLGGRERLLDVLGANYYRDNQWIFPGDLDSSTTIGPEHPAWKPPRALLQAAWARYNRPILLAETGIEGEPRASWLHHLATEARAAIVSGVELVGVCWYPVTDYPGWDDDRHCPTGLWGYADDFGHRAVYEPLLQQLREEQNRTRALHADASRDADGRGEDKS